MALALLVSGCGNPFVVSLPGGRQTVLLERGNAPSALVSGNYCGYGARHGHLSARPQDRLDAACLAHDVCYISGANHCECNDRLENAARAISADRRTDPDMRRRADAIMGFYRVKFCRVFPQGLLPPRQKGVLGSVYGNGAQ